MRYPGAIAVAFLIAVAAFILIVGVLIPDTPHPNLAEDGPSAPSTKVKEEITAESGGLPENALSPDVPIVPERDEPTVGRTPPPDGPPILVGRVLGDGEPAPGARIYILDGVVEQMVFHCRTDENGDYRAVLDRPGKYFVKASCYGYKVKEDRRSEKFQKKETTVPGVCDFEFGIPAGTGSLEGKVSVLGKNDYGNERFVPAQQFRIYVFREKRRRVLGGGLVESEIARRTEIGSRASFLGVREFLFEKEFEDPEGVFKLDGLESGHYLLAAETLDGDPNPGRYANARSDKVFPDAVEPCDLYARPVTAYHGFVKSADDDAPIEGAKIVFFRERGDNSGVPSDKRRFLELIATSDSNGEFRADGISGLWYSRASHPGFVDFDYATRKIAWTSKDGIKDPMVLYLSRNLKPGVVKGDLSACAALGFENLRVLVHSWFAHRGYKGSLSESKMRLAAPGADGTFRFDGLCAGKGFTIWIIDVASGRVVDERHNCFIPEDTGEVYLDFGAGAGTVEGVVTIGGRPAEDVGISLRVPYSVTTRIVIRKGEPRTEEGCEIILKTSTDSEGRYVLFGIPPNNATHTRYSLSAHLYNQPVDGSIFSDREKFTIAAGERREINFDFESQSCICFVFKEKTTGENTASGRVSIRPISGPGGRTVKWRERSDSQIDSRADYIDSYRKLYGLPPGWYRTRTEGDRKRYRFEEVDFYVTGEEVQFIKIPYVDMRRHTVVIKVFERDTGEPLCEGLPGRFYIEPPWSTHNNDWIWRTNSGSTVFVEGRTRNLADNEIPFWVPEPGNYKLVLFGSHDFYDYDSEGRRNQIEWPPKEEAEFDIRVSAAPYQEIEVWVPAIVRFKVTALDAAGYPFEDSGDGYIRLDTRYPDGRLIFWRTTSKTQDDPFMVPGAGKYIVRVSWVHGDETTVLVEEEIYVDYDHGKESKNQSFTIMAEK